MRTDFETLYHGERATDGRFSLANPANGLFATTGRDKVIAIWQCLPVINACGIDRAQPVVSICTSTVPECTWLDYRESIIVFGTVTGSIKVFSLEAEKLVNTLTGHNSIVTSIKQSPRNEFIWASASLDKSVRLFDLRACTHAVAKFSHHTSGIRVLSWSPHGQWILSGNDEGAVKLNDLACVTTPLTSLDAHTARVTDVTFHPHEFFLATASMDRTVRFWDAETFECVSQSPTMNCAPQRLLFNAKPGTKCLFAATENEVRALSWEPYDQCSSASLLHDVTHNITSRQIFDLIQLDQELRVLSAINGNRIMVQSLETWDTSPFIDGDKQETTETLSFTSDSMETSNFMKNTKIRRSFHEKMAPKDMITDSGDSVSASTSTATTPSTDNSISFDSSMKSVSRNASTRSLSSRAKKTRNERKSGGNSISLNVKVPLMAGETEVFKKRDKLHHSPIRLPSNENTEVNETFIVQQREEKESPRQKRNASTSRTPNKTSPNKTSSVDDDSISQRSKSNSRIAKVQPQPSKISPVPKLVAVVKANHPHAVPDNQVESPSVVGNRLLIKETPSTSTKIDDARSFFAELDVASKTDVILRQRARGHQHIIRTWRADGATRAVDAAMQVNDLGVVVDILNLLNRKSTLYTLDVCASVLSRLPYLLTSRHEIHNDTTRKTLVQLRAAPVFQLIKNNTGKTSIGVDLANDDRREKAKQCRLNLMKLGDDAQSLSKEVDSSTRRRLLKEISLLVDSFK